jgi:hypothetical protein
MALPSSSGEHDEVQRKAAPSSKTFRDELKISRFKVFTAEKK